MLNFKNEKLDKADFTGIDAPDSLFDSCSMRDCEFEGNFEESEFLNCHLQSKFTHCSLEGIKITNSSLLDEVTFHTSDLTGAVFNANHGSIKVYNSNLENINFESYVGELRVYQGTDLVQSGFTLSESIYIFSSSSTLKGVDFRSNKRVNLRARNTTVENVKIFKGEVGVSLLQNTSVDNLEIDSASSVLVDLGDSASAKNIFVTNSKDVTLDPKCATENTLVMDCSNVKLSLANSIHESLVIKTSSMTVYIFQAPLIKSHFHGITALSGEVKSSSLRSCGFVEGIFQSFTFTDVVFDQSRWEHSSLSLCTLKETKFLESRFEGHSSKKNNYFKVDFLVSCVFIDVESNTNTYKDCLFSDVSFEGVTFHSDTFLFVDFVNCSFKDTKFIDCKMAGLGNVKFQSCIFDNKKKTFAQSDISGVNFV